MLGKIHFYFGMLIVVIFLLTGQYMHHEFGHLKEMELMSRALFRAGHLYILLFGLINIALGINFHKPKTSTLIKFQLFGSIVILLASILIIYAFFIELPAKQIERPLTRISLYLILLGVSTNGIVYMFDKEKRVPSV